MPQSTQPCPICQSSVPFDPRYPNAVCSSCVEAAVDCAGRPLRFYNESMSGGIYGVFADTSEQAPETTCFIHGVECQAQEARMGGIVIIPKAR